MTGRAGRLVWFLLVTVPLGALVLAALRLAVPRPEVMALALPTGRRWTLLVTTVVLAGGVAVVATALGFLGALTLATGRAGRHRLLRWLPVLLAPLPPYVHALAWNDALGWLAGVITGGGAPPPASGPGMVLWVETMAVLPITTALGLVGILNLPRPSVEAARLHRADPVVLGRVVLPLAAPFLAASAGLAFLLVATAHDVPSLHAVTTFPLEIFAEFSAGHDAARATILALPALVVSVLVLALVIPALRRARVGTTGGLAGIAWRWPAWFRGLQGVVAAVLAAQFLVPVVSLAARPGSWKGVVSGLTLAGPELGFSLIVAASAAVLAIPLASALARGLRSPLWWVLAFVPLAVPAPLVGIALLAVFNPVLPMVLLDSPLLPVLAALLRFTPFATFVLLAGLRRRQRDRIDAVRVFQPGPLAGWVGVRLHLEAPTVLAASGFVFALSLGELGATLLVLPPGRSTLAIRISNYLHYGAAQDVRGLCLVLLVVTTVTGLGVAALVSRGAAGRPAA